MGAPEPSSCRPTNVVRSHGWGQQRVGAASSSGRANAHGSVLGPRLRTARRRPRCGDGTASTARSGRDAAHEGQGVGAMGAAGSADPTARGRRAGFGGRAGEGQALQEAPAQICRAIAAPGQGSSILMNVQPPVCAVCRGTGQCSYAWEEQPAPCPLCRPDAYRTHHERQPRWTPVLMEGGQQEEAIACFDHRLNNGG